MYKKPICAIIAILTISGCATHQRPVAPNHDADVVNIKKVELFYHSDSYAVVVGQAGGLLALASIGESNRIEQRSKALTEAIERDFPARKLNFAFAEKLADEIRKSGREVKLTEVNRPVGNADIFKTEHFRNAPLTPGFAPLMLRVSTGYGAPSFMQSFESNVEVSYVLANQDRTVNLKHGQHWRRGTGSSFGAADTLIENHKQVYANFDFALTTLVPAVYSEIFK